MPAPYIKDAFVINTGDFLKRWCNDKVKSTLRRVKVPPVDSKSGITKVRYFIPSFVSANRVAVISCLPGTYDENNIQKYESITSADYYYKCLDDLYA